MSLNSGGNLINLAIPLILLLLVSAPFVMESQNASGTDMTTLEDAIGYDEDAEEQTLEEKLKEIDDAPAQHNKGDNIGKSKVMVSVNYDDGTTETIASEPMGLFLASQTFVHSEKVIDNLRMRIDFDIEDFDVTSTTAAFIILACPSHEYCDWEGSTTSKILCGDTTECGTGFDEASPYVIFDPKDYANELNSMGEDTRIVLAAHWIVLELVSKLDSKKYTAVLECQTEGSCGQSVEVDIREDSNNVATADGGNIEVDPGQHCDPFCEDDLQPGDTVTLYPGAETMVVEDYTYCTGISNPAQPFECSAGMCNYTYSNSRSESVRECP